MKSKNEQALVGIFVIVASALLIGTVLAVSGTFSGGGLHYHTYFKSAGGLLPGATVRYAGMKAGKVDKVRVDPNDSTRIEIDFSVDNHIPVKTNSVARIASLGALADNYVEIGTGRKDAPPAPSGSELKSIESLSISDLSEMIGTLVPVAQKVLLNLDERLTDLQVTVARVNDLLNDKNRANISGSLGNLNGMLSDSRPKLAVTLTNVQGASEKISPLLDDLKVTMKQANDTLSHVDAIAVENRQDIRQIVTSLRETMLNASALLEELKNTTDRNVNNIDEIILNIQETTENLKQLTNELKARPSLLIHGNTVKDRKPGEPVK
jgi:phospholipid/cholesterol/gamma-HCH transport system substrate-binding protein